MACCAGAFLFAAVAVAQEQSGDWRLTGGDAGQTGWQKGEIPLPRRTPARTSSFSGRSSWGNLRNPPAPSASRFSGGPPDQRAGIQRHRVLEFRRHPLRRGLGVGCDGLDEGVQIILQARARMRSLQPANTDGAADGNQFQRPAATRSRCSEATRSAAGRPNERRLGVAPGGGYFGLKGVYVLTPDGMLHEQVMTTGADFGRLP